MMRRAWVALLLLLVCSPASAQWYGGAWGSGWNSASDDAAIAALKAGTNTWTGANTYGPVITVRRPYTYNNDLTPGANTGTTTMALTASANTGADNYEWASTVYRVEIDSEGAPDTFKWRRNASDTWTEGVAVTLEPIVLENGITIQFSATDTGAVGDSWEWSYGSGGGDTALAIAIGASGGNKATFNHEGFMVTPQGTSSTAGEYYATYLDLYNADGRHLKGEVAKLTFTQADGDTMIHEFVGNAYTLTASSPGTVRVVGAQFLTSATITTDMLDAGVLALDFSAGNTIEQTIDAAVTSVTLTGANDAGAYSALLCYSGAFGIDWPATWKWVGGAVPTESATAGTCDTLFLKVFASGKIVAELALDCDEP